MRRIYLLLFSAILFAGVANAQSSANYAVSSTTTGSLSLDLNSNTVDMSTGTTQLVGSSNDDLASSVATIGFDYWFMGVRYTQFSANSNGSIRLGGTAIANANYGITSTSANSIISPFGGDLETSSTGKVHYKMVGTAPNRCLVVEFLNMALDYTGAYLNPDGTYQVRLYETTGKIEFVYGGMNVNSSTVNSGTLTFNIGFSTGTTTANTFLCINNTSTNAFSTTAFTALAPARPGSGTAPITDLTSVADGSRKTYLFTPGIPVDPTGLSFPVVGATTMTLNWTDNASNEVGFAVYRSTDGTNFTFINQVAAGAATGTTIVSAQTGLTPGTNYFWRVYAVTEGAISNVLIGSLATNAAASYTWNQTGSAAFGTAANWTPTRTTPDVTDVLIFDGASTPTPVVTGIATGTIGKLILQNNANVTLQSAATATLTISGGAGDDLDIPAGSTLLSNGTTILTIAFSAGTTANVAGTFEISNTSVVNVLNLTNCVMTVTSAGKLAAGGTVAGSPWTGVSATTLLVGGTYEHKYTTTTGTIPTANWQTNSTCLISGYTSSTSGPTGFGQTFYNVIWNCSSQTANLSCGGTIPTAVNGTLTVTNTGTGQFRWGATSAWSSTINNYLQNGGFTDLTTGTGAPTLNVTGTFNQTAGTFQVSGTGTTTINFNGSSGAQNVNFFNAAPIGPIVYRINNTAGISLTGSGTLTTNFNINSGGGIRVSALAATPITTTLALTYSATGSTLTYDASTGAQTATATEFPATSGPANLTINNTTAVPNRIVNIPFDRTAPGTLTLTAGDISMGVNTLTLGTSTAALGTLSAGSNVIIGKFKRWISAATGNRDFPVGVATIQRNASINYTVAPGAGGTLTTEFISTDPGTTGLPLVEGAINVNTAAKTGYWKIDAADGLTGGTYTGTFTARGFAGVNTFNGLVLLKRPSGGGNWVLDGTHVTTTGSNAIPVLSRTAIGTGFSEFGVGGDNAVNPLGQSIVSIATGNWGDASTWNTATVPTAGDAVTIVNGHNVTLASGTPPYVAGSLTINSGGTLTANANTLNIGGALINNGTVNAGGATINVTAASGTGITNGATTGVFTISGGTVNLGITDNTACNRTLTNNGTLTVSSGTLNVYGNILSDVGSTFNQSGGNINVDGNAGGNAANSVASSTAIVRLNATAFSNVNLTGGTFTIVDPHAASTLTNVFAFSTSVTGTLSVTSAHTFRLGNGVSTDAGGNVGGFSYNPWVTTGGISMGNMVLNGPAGTNRSVVLPGTFTPLFCTGDLTINSGATLSQTTTTLTAAIAVGGNITVNTGGTLMTQGLVLLGNGTYASGTTIAATASTIPQSLTNAGTIQNLPASPTANFTNLQVINSNATGVTLNAALSASGTLTLTQGFINTTTTNLLTLGTATAAGTLSGGSSASYIKGPFARTFAASRTAAGTYSVATLYPVGKGASYLPIHIDPSTNAGGAIVMRGEAFTTNSGTPGAGVTTLSSNRWEALVTNGGANFTNSFIRLNDAAIAATNKILQSSSAAGSYIGIPAATSYAAGTPNTLTTATNIATASYSGYFAYGDLTACSAPLDQPTAFTTSLLGATSFTGSFTAAVSAPSNYLVVRYASAATPTAPVDFTAYTVGGSLGTGTVVSISSATSFTQSGLTVNTTYDYYVYSYNNSGCGGPVYRTTTPLFASVTTCAAPVGVPGTPTSGAINPTNFVINWTASSNPTATYELDVATNSGFTSLVPGYNALNVGSVLTYNVGLLSPATTYYVRLRAVDGGCYSVNSGTLTVTTACNPINTLPWNDGFESLVSFGAGIVPTCWTAQLVSGTNLTSANTPVRNGLGARTGTNYIWSRWSSDTWLYTPGLDLTGGTSYDFSFYYRQTDAIAGFTVTAAYGSSAASGSMTNILGTITDPVNTAYVQVKYSFTPVSSGTYYIGVHSVSPNTDPWYMEYDDFKLELSPACPAPTAISVISPTSTTASVSFTSAGNNFIVEYGAPGFTPGTGATPGAGGTIVTGTASPISISGLTAATAYDVYVRQVCAGPIYGANAGVVSFTTACTAATIPYLEDFESLTTPGVPACIAVEDLNGATTWTGFTGGATSASSGTKSIRYNFSTPSKANDWFYTRALTLTAGTSYRLRFKYKASDGPTYIEQLEVKYGTTRAATSMTLGTLFTNTNINNNINTPFLEGIADFTPSSTGDYYIGFHCFSDQDQAFLYVDDVSVDLTPSCPSPISVTVGSITATTASVSFTSPGTNFIVEYGLAGFTPGTDNTAGAGGTILTGTASPIAIPGPLTPATTYDVYVRRICAGPEYSANATVVTFTTECTAVSIPYTENFDGVTAPALPTCVTVQDINGITTWANATGQPNSSPNNMVYTFDTDFPANDWFFTAPLSLTGSTSYRLTFQYRARSSTFPEALEVKYAGPGTSNVISGGTILFTNTSITNETYTLATIDFTPPSTGTYYIGFHAISDPDEWELHVDDISVDLSPACSAPGAVTVTATGATSASVSFTPVGAGNDYIVEYGAEGFTPGTGATAGAGGTVVTGNAGSPIAITGIALPDATLDVYVRKVCAGPSYSANSTVTKFLRNDDAVGAMTLTVNAGCTGPTYTNANATKSVNEVYPSCSGNAETPVWFKFVAPASGAVRITTDTLVGTFTDSKLGLFSATDASNYGTFTILSCDDDGGSSLGFGFMSVLYATGLTPGNTYYVSVDKFGSGTTAGTFCIAVDELQASMLALSANNCTSGTYQTPAGTNATYTGSVPLMDQDSKLIAIVKNPAGGSVEDYSVSMTVNTAAVRTDATSGERYLNRNFHIANSAGATNVQVQFFLLNSELAALNAVDPAATLANMRVTHQTGATCQSDFVTANGTNTELVQTGSGTVNGVSWVNVTTPSFSNFFLHSTKTPIIAKTFLQGAYNAGLGRHKNVTTTWQNVLIANALTQPYNTAAFGNYNGGENVGSGFFTSDNTSDRDVVDWVLLEIRDGANVLLGRRAALVREDGKILDTNGDSLINFNGLVTGTYYVTIRHRNHLGISSQNLLPVTARALGVAPTTANTFDFTTESDANIFGTTAAFAISGGKNLMIGGNANSNGNIRYLGSGNDPGVILVFLLGSTGTVLTNVYTPSDVNLDGIVRYLGSNNDPGFILANPLGGSTGVVVVEQKR